MSTTDARVHSGETCAVCGVAATRVLSLRVDETLVADVTLCSYHAFHVEHGQWGLCVQLLSNLVKQDLRG